jgi:hypothetical protein
MDMTTFDIWKYLHILMFVGWVGADMGVFLSARKSTDPKWSFESRMLLLHMALRIELLPRTMWKAALPLGVMLSVDMGLLDIGSAGIAMVWLFTVIWWAISMSGAFYYDKPVGQKLAKIANSITGFVGVALIVTAIASYLGKGPFDPDATWLLWKVGLYGMINLTCLGIVVAFDPMGAAFGRLAVEGSTPEVEGEITKIFNISTFPIWTTYALVVFVAFVATTRFI